MAIHFGCILLTIKVTNIVAMAIETESLLVLTISYLQCAHTYIVMGPWTEPVETFYHILVGWEINTSLK